MTGCRRGCKYCYARRMAERFPERYPKGFKPHFRQERLAAPQNTTIPKKRQNEAGIRNVFVCSMGELFGEWVPKGFEQGGRTVDVLESLHRKSSGSEESKSRANSFFLALPGPSATRPTRPPAAFPTRRRAPTGRR